MNQDQLQSLEALEADLWEAADQLRANSKLTSNEYCMPVLGVIFLRQAANRFDAVTKQIQEDQASGKAPKRPIRKEDYIRRRALYLPEKARYENILALPKQANLGQELAEAMKAIEGAFPPLDGVLPKEYTIFERTVLEDLIRIFNRDALRAAGGDLFGRIYEYFLMKFAMQGAQDNGEFFTPPSLVQTIVNVIEPEHGIVFDPACGSGGMFVQSSHFIERLGKDTAKRVTFYGQEKTATTIKLARMNLAVHGLEGDIREANTFYEDAHTLFGKCDFVMANPPFNVDMVDAEKVRGDRRLPFGLPGVNKSKKVSSGNYLWISYFHSYLNDRGRAGFIMSSQASSAGHAEKDVREKIIQTGDVDVIISIRSNFFYTRPVPCELWFFDRGKPKDRRDHVLMIDARNVFRKVNRTINDFSFEQLADLSAIVWLYRGERNRFLRLVHQYLAATCAEAEKVGATLSGFEIPFSAVDEVFANVRVEIEKSPTSIDGGADFLAAADELSQAYQAYSADRTQLESVIAKFRKKCPADSLLAIADQQSARKAFDPVAERLRGMVKQVDLVFKLTSRAGEAARDLLKNRDEAGNGEPDDFVFDRRRLARLLKDLDSARKETTDQLKHATYFHRNAAWLLDRFPEGKLSDVPGLVKLVSRVEIEAADWSLTPGRYVGVAPAEVDEDFDFEHTMQDIHTELADLNQDAVELAAEIERNFEELGI
jgi:type I restriction enzyme M protein